MSNVVADISMSLDGFVTGPDPGPGRGLGRDGEAIQQWVFSSHSSPQDRAFLEAAESTTGAVIMGRRTFDFVDAPGGWDEDIGYGYDHPLASMPPVFVLTHQPPARTRHDFTFITTGVHAAVDAARAVAGERDVVVMGGAEVIDQVIRADLADRLRIHLSPVLIGSGTRLFDLVGERIELVQDDVVVTSHATHLTYRL